ncbi:hypothetical protein ERHA55_32280 [Erwinia rhapontici]|nr:hypothetical protein ERHA55_32280 [Erwinia rhapontici]
MTIKGGDWSGAKGSDLLFRSTFGEGLHDGSGPGPGPGQRQRQGRFAFPLRGLSDPGWAVTPTLGTRACGWRCVHCVDTFASAVHRRTGRDGTSLCRLSLSPPSWRLVLVHCASSALLNAASTSKPRSKPKSISKVSHVVAVLKPTAGKWPQTSHAGSSKLKASSCFFRQRLVLFVIRNTGVSREN